MKNNNNNRLQTDESKFLKGPLSRFKELFFIRVMFSFVKSFRKMHFIGQWALSYRRLRVAKTKKKWTVRPLVGLRFHADRGAGCPG